ncbi:MAG: protein kinase [Candidatus Acidiferrales bacterium]|jgi:Tol biopolymer transport system component
MAIATGTRLGPYEILSAIGAGGMGEVYRARDSRLERVVAIKVLLAPVAGQDGLRERFEREARAISSLSHPHICVLHDVGHQDGIDYLVMELLEGQTLAARLAKGPLPLDRVLRYAIEIADALDKAHRKGITHRDLKPGNIMLTKSGIKLLDFGLAKLKQEASPVSTFSQQATAQNPITAQGVILGTLQYMAPEQVEGKEVDARADIFAFGAVVYEMATGKKAFGGNSQASVIAAILERDPPPISSVQPMTPPALERVVKRCLAKDPDDRWQTARDLEVELQWIADSGSQSGLTAPDGAAGSAVTRANSKRAWLPWAVAALTVVLAMFAAFFLPRKASAPPGIYRFTVRLPENAQFTRSASLVLSPDGHRVAFPAVGADGRSSIWVQDMDGEEARALSGTESFDPPPPFWSPDSRYIVFSSISKIRKVNVQDGTVEDICDRPATPVGGSWNRDGVIIFGSFATGLWRVPEGGGTAAPLTVLDPSRHERTHQLPTFLPDGRHFLYLRSSNVAEESGVYVGSLDDPPERQSEKRVLANQFGAIYVPSNGSGAGHLLFYRDGVVMAQVFDPDKLEVRGDPVSVAERVGSAFETGHFSASADVLVYREKTPPLDYQLTWFDTQGKMIGKVGDPGDMTLGPHLSPDGSRVADAKASPNVSTSDIWLLDLRRGTNTRFTFGRGSSSYPVWSPDGSEIVFSSNRDGFYDLYRRPTDGSRAEQLLLRTNDDKRAFSWSRDGRFLLYSTSRGFGREHLWVLPMQGEPKPISFSAEGSDESLAQFSPDGRWVAYTSNETGQYEVYVREFTGSASSAGAGGKWLVSKDSGIVPMWREDGRELAYLTFDRTSLMSLSVDTTHSFQAGVPRLLAKTPEGFLGAASFLIAPTPDLKRFLIPVTVEQKAPEGFKVMLNWTSALAPK